MTYVPEQIKQFDECSFCGRKLKAGDGCITYETANLELVLGSCCALTVLGSLIADAEKAVKSTDQTWVYGMKEEKIRNVANVANELANGLIKWAECQR
jgi:hypothetical protein